MYNNVIRYLLLVFGLTLSAVAAFCSVYGISHLFAGGGIVIIILAAVLEISKIVSISFIYRFWANLKLAMRIYFISAVIAVSIITNLGIYGYLTNSYQQSLQQFETRARVEQIAINRTSFIENDIQRLAQESDAYTRQIETIRSGLANPTMIQYIDSETGQLVTTTSSRQRKELETQLTNLIKNKTIIDSQRVILQDSIYTINENLLTSDTLSIATELGSLSFISEVTGYEMNQIVNIFVIIIMMIFDPLAIMMILGFNITTKKIEKKSIHDLESSEKETILVEEDIKDIVISDTNSDDITSIPEEKNELPKQESKSKIVSTYGG